MGKGDNNFPTTSLALKTAQRWVVYSLRHFQTNPVVLTVLLTILLIILFTIQRVADVDFKAGQLPTIGY